MTRSPDIELKRHYRKLSDKQTDELVNSVADLVVAFIKQGQESPVEATAPANDPQTRRS